MANDKKFEIVSQRDFDDLFISLKSGLEINFYIVEKPNETAVEISIEVISITTKTSKRDVWLFKGYYQDPEHGKIPLDGIIQEDPFSGELILHYP